jgi:ribulose-bisphosphate carboxylase small chain
MRITQGTFSFLPELTDAQIVKQLEYALGQGFAISIEHTDDPHPRNTFWEMWSAPMFDQRDAGAAMKEVAACRKAFPAQYVKVNAFDNSSGWETVRLSFLVQRPAEEPGFALERQECEGRNQRYSMRGYAAQLPAGKRYGGRT